MWNIFKTTMLKPLFERVGTVGAVWLLAAGDKLCEAVEQACGLVTEDGVGVVLVWITAAALVALDWSVSWINRRREKAVR